MTSFGLHCISQAFDVYPRLPEVLQSLPVGLKQAVIFGALPPAQHFSHKCSSPCVLYSLLTLCIETMDDVKEPAEPFQTSPWKPISRYSLNSSEYSQFWSRGFPEVYHEYTAHEHVHAICDTYAVCRRLRDPSPDEIEALTLEGMREALESQLHAGNVEVNIVGDFKAEELDKLLVNYLGTVEPAQSPPQRIEEPIDVRFPAKEVRQQVWHLKDSDERAAAYIAGLFLSHTTKLNQDSELGWPVMLKVFLYNPACRPSTQMQ